MRRGRWCVSLTCAGRASRPGRSPLAAENEQVIAYAHELVGLRCPAPRESVVYGAVDVPAGSEAMLQNPRTWQNPESKIQIPVPDLKLTTHTFLLSFWCGNLSESAPILNSGFRIFCWRRALEQNPEQSLQKDG